MACRLLPVTVLLLQACGGDDGGGGAGGAAGDASLTGGAGGEVVGQPDAAVNGGTGGAPVTEPDGAVGVEPDAAVAVEPDAAVAPPPLLNGSCDDAAANTVTLALDAADATQGTLSPVATAQRYFILTQGEGDPAPGSAIALFTDAKPAEDEFAAAYPDLVVTLYARQGGQWAQVAQNDDPEPRFSNDSELFTRLPASEDGRYCVRVAECTAVFGAEGCAPAADITNDAFALQAVNLRPELQEAEPNDDAATASPLGYQPIDTGGYYSVVESGNFGAPTDVDVWAFSVPADVFTDFDPSAGEVAGACRFEFFRPGADGSGSTAAAGVLASVADAADPLTPLARTDVFADPAIPAEVGFRCVAGGNYVFSVARSPDAAVGANDFYFWRHALTQTNPIEAEGRAGGTPDANNTGATAEALVAVQNDDGSVSYFVEAAIDHADDADYFSVEVPAGMTKFSAACGGQRIGSGVRNLTLRTFTGADLSVPVDGATATESAAEDLGLTDVDIAGNTGLVLAITAQSLDPGVRGAGYRCGFHLSP